MADTAIELLSSLHIIEYVEKDQPISIGSASSEPLFSQQYALHNIGQNIQGRNGQEDEDIGLIEAKNNSKLTQPNVPPIIVAVIDTGIDLDHPDLVNNIWVNTGEIPDDGIDNDGNGYIDDVTGINLVAGNNNTDDDNGHGTHCSSIIGSSNNGLGIAGIAGDFVKIMPIKILDANGSGSLRNL